MRITFFLIPVLLANLAFAGNQLPNVFWIEANDTLIMVDREKKLWLKKGPNIANLRLCENDDALWGSKGSCGDTPDFNTEFFNKWTGTKNQYGLSFNAVISDEKRKPLFD